MPGDKKGPSKDEVVNAEELASRLEAAGAAYQSIIDMVNAHNAGTKVTESELKKIEKSLGRIEARQEKIKSIDQQIADLKIGEGKMLSSIIGLTDKQLGKDKALLKEAKHKLKIMSLVADADQDKIKHLQATLSAMIKQRDAMKKLSKEPGLKEGFIAASAAADGLQSQIDGVFDNIPGGATISKMLGLNEVGANIQKELGSAFDAAIKDAAASGNPIDPMVTAQKAFNAATMLNPWAIVGLAIAAAAAGLAGLVSLASKHEEKARGVADQMGVSVMNGEKMLNNAYKLEASFDAQLSSAEDILKVQEQVANEFGLASAMSGKVALEVSEIGNAFGYGAEQAGQVQSALMGMGVGSEEAADMQRELGAELFATGTNISEAMADVTQAAKKHARYFKGNAKQLMKAAVQAAKMGVSLDTMASIADGLLDIESSLTAQFEFQAMTGKQLNLDEARRLAYAGDMVGATKEVLNNIGGYTELSKLGPVQMKKLEEATGMTADEMLKAAAIQKAMPNATKEQVALMQEMGLSAAEIADLDADQLQAKMAEHQEAKKMQQSMTALSNQMKKALLPVAEAVLSVFSAISPVLKVIAGLIKMIMKPINNMANLLTGNTSEMTAFGKAIAVALTVMTSLYGIGKLIKFQQSFSAKRMKVRVRQLGRILGLEKFNLKMLGQKSTYEKLFANFRKSGLVQTTKLGAIKVGQFAKDKAALAMEKAGKMGIWIKEKAHWAKTGAVKMGIWAKEKAHLVMVKVQQGIIYGMQKAQWAIEKAHLILKTAMEKGMLAVQYAINAAKIVSNAISAGALIPLMAAAGASIAAAIPAIFTGFGMIPFGIGIPLAFATVAGLIALVASMSKGDDVISSPSGGSGYGSRVLFGPEGAISFNNKDTIVAGTNLGYQMNDGVIAPAGAIKVDDYAEGEPAEANVVSLGNDAAKKIGFAVMAGQRGLLGNLFGGGDEAPPTQLGEETIVKQVAGFGLALMGIVPALTMAVTAGMIAGATATALIPKPVLVMNPVMTFETNPMTYSMMGALGGIASGIGGLFGGGGESEDPNSAIIAKLDEVKHAISNMQINMDGQKVGNLTRAADSFRRRG